MKDLYDIYLAIVVLMVITGLVVYYQIRLRDGYL